MFEVLPDRVNGLIYQITNEVNGQIYIGQTIRSLLRRWSNHLHSSRQPKMADFPLYRAIRKYGHEHFTTQVIAYADSVMELNELERMMVHLLGANVKGIGYNADSGGGRGKRMTPEHRQKMSDYMKGRTLQSRAIMEEKVWSKNRGKKRSKETCEKIGAAHRGTKMPAHVKEALRLANANRPGNNRVAVRCVETGEVLQSLEEACAFDGCWKSQMSQHINHGQRLTSGHHYERLPRKSK